jgi:hypothetical protein
MRDAYKGARATWEGTMRSFAIVAVSVALVGGMPLALADNKLPSNNIDCAVFSKLPNDRWHVGAPTKFEIGPQRVNLSPMDIEPHAIQIGDFDLYDVLER